MSRASWLPHVWYYGVSSVVPFPFVSQWDWVKEIMRTLYYYLGTCLATRVTRSQVQTMFEAFSTSDLAILRRSISYTSQQPHLEEEDDDDDELPKKICTTKAPFVWLHPPLLWSLLDILYNFWFFPCIIELETLISTLFSLVSNNPYYFPCEN